MRSRTIGISKVSSYFFIPGEELRNRDQAQTCRLLHIAESINSKTQKNKARQIPIQESKKGSSVSTSSTMHRKLLFTLFTLFCVSELYLKQVCEAVDGRRELSSYWRDVMKDEDMPEAIQGLVLEDGQKTQEASFDREFQARPNLIIYHSGPDQVDVKGLEQEGGMTEPGV